MDAHDMTECARRAWLRHGMSWTQLSFDQRYEIIKELEAEHPAPKAAAVTIPVRRRDGSSEGILGGTGGPLDTKPAPKTPGADEHAVELMRQAHREADGCEYVNRGGRFSHPVR
jgi:hypothetical protein